MVSPLLELYFAKSNAVSPLCREAGRGEEGRGAILSRLGDERSDFWPRTKARYDPLTTFALGGKGLASAELARPTLANILSGPRCR